MIGVLKYLSLIVFPVIRIGFPIPVPLIFLIFIKKWELLKSYFYPLLFSSIYLLIAIIISNFKSLSFSSVTYFVFPLIYIILIHIFLQMKNVDRIIKIYFFINLIIVTITFFYIPPPLELFYDKYLLGNVTAESHYLDDIGKRGVGLLGHPAWLALMAYLLGKYLSIKEGKYRYVLLSVIPIVFSGGRAALFMLMALEFYFLVKRKIKNPIKFIRNLILASILCVTTFLLVYKFNANFQYFVDVTLYDLRYGDGDFRSGSIENRLEMLSLLFSQNILVILFGSGSILQQMQGLAIDTEFVMRSLQFGLIGFCLLLIPSLIARKNSMRANNEKGKEIGLFIFLFCLLGSLTTTIASNMIFMIYISLILASVEKENIKIINQ